jgi:hypothetical protein
MHLKHKLIESFMFRKFSHKEITEKVYQWMKDKQVDTKGLFHKDGQKNLEDCIAKRLKDWNLKAEDKPPADTYAGFLTAREAASALCLWFSDIESDAPESQSKEKEVKQDPRNQYKPAADRVGMQPEGPLGRESVTRKVFGQVLGE